MTYPLPEAVLFDHDGTLVDTEPLWAKAKEKLAAEFNTVWTEEDTMMCLGQPMSLTVHRLQELGVDLPDKILIERLGNEAHEAVKNSPVKFLPGIENLLRELAEAGIPAAIVTNATKEVATMTASRAPKGLFRAIIGNEDVTTPKPDPQPYLLAAERLGVVPARCVAIEDSPSGSTSAVAAGLKVVVVPGMQPVAPAVGDAHWNHEEITLEALRHLFTQSA